MTRSGWLTLGMSRPMTTRVTIPIGMLTKKIQCQPTVSVRMPPVNGPTSIATAKTAPKKPW